MALFRSFRRYFIRRRPFPASWLRLLQDHVPYYRILPADLQKSLQMHLPVMMDEKIFEGCGGLKMTEEKQIIISSYALILILAEPAGYYPDLKAILVYPDNYVAQVQDEDESGIMTEGIETRSGESWDLGSIVLSWSDIQSDLQHPFRGRNLILHEFSHQLDDRYGLTAGMDEDGNIHTPSEWNRVLSASYRRLREGIERHETSILDPYGATNPAEFFAVSTESFFENGRMLREKLPELYRMLAAFYKMDPASFRF